MVTFDPDALRARLAELDEQVSAPDFWNDPQRAAKVSAEHQRAQRKLQRYDDLVSNVEFLQEGVDAFPDEELLPTLREVQAELSRLQEDALFSGEYDGGDAVVTIQADAGGTDAQDWAEILLRMYLRWAEERGFKTEVIETSPGEEYGIKSATFTLRGDNAYGILKAERGKHRLVRLSPFDSAHRRHTSFAQVIVAPLLEEAGDIAIEDDDIRIDTYRSSGAGGQHVNKTDSAVRITHMPSGIVVSVQNERSQSANKETAMKILRSRLAERAEEEREAELARERGGVSMGFGGNAIRSYVLHPYQQVKDARTGFEVGNAQGVLDGDLDGFIRAYLLQSAGNAG
ncbi:MAG: peptide chain release factor 2 [Actinobacteria bacterium]|nr:peptide chain release factor 2 [Actinomycetota bacterium]